MCAGAIINSRIEKVTFGAYDEKNGAAGSKINLFEVPFTFRTEYEGGVMEEVRRIFKPEFLNRIDEIIVFHMLNKEQIKKIVTLLLKTLEKRCAEQMDICLTVTGAVKDFIVEKGSDNKYGARPLRRAIQSRIEDALANEILEGKIKRGDHVQVRLHKEEILFEVKN